jgi:hypothetical protein
MSYLNLIDAEPKYIFHPVFDNIHGVTKSRHEVACQLNADSVEDRFAFEDDIRFALSNVGADHNDNRQFATSSDENATQFSLAGVTSVRNKQVGLYKIDNALGFAQRQNTIVKRVENKPQTSGDPFSTLSGKSVTSILLYGGIDVLNGAQTWRYSQWLRLAKLLKAKVVDWDFQHAKKLKDSFSDAYDALKAHEELGSLFLKSSTKPANMNAEIELIQTFYNAYAAIANQNSKIGQMSPGSVWLRWKFFEECVAKVRSGSKIPRTKKQLN